MNILHSNKENGSQAKILNKKKRSVELRSTQSCLLHQFLKRNFFYDNNVSMELTVTL